MLHNIQFKTAFATCKPAYPAKRVVMTETLKERAKVFKEVKTELKLEPTSEITSKLNELAKRRPFNILYRVKKYDPL
jgi:hypothetical protein